MLDSKFKLERKSKGEYVLSLPIDSDWKKKTQRVLVVLETVDSQDLSENTLLHDRSRTVVENLLRFSSSRAKLHGFKRADCAFAVVNYNNIKFMDKPKETWPAYKKAFSNRVRRAIKELEPTHVLVCGDHAAESLLTPFEIEYINKKRGWVYDLEFGKHKTKVVTTLDLNTLYTAPKKDYLDDDDDEGDEDLGKDIFAKSNLMFYVSEHVVNCLCSKHLFNLAHIKPKPVYIDTIDKFKSFYSELLEQRAVAIDTETRNGTVLHNAVHTIQFAFEEGKGYFLPYRHPETPWSKKELKYIRKKLRAFLIARPKECKLKYLITQYGMFDLRVCRVEFGIPVIRHAVWEITAGEYCFDKDTLVQTEQGDIRIEDLVEMDKPPKVWSFNHETQVRELKELDLVTKHETEEQMLEIEYEGGVLRVTENHKIWCVNRQAYVRAKDLTCDDELQLPS